MLFDTHCHLQDKRIYEKKTEILQKAKEKGVHGLICNGSMVHDWRDVKDICNAAKHIVPAFGIHPFYVEDLPASWFPTLKAYLMETPSLVGEIGLDLLLAKTSIEKQYPVFEAQLALAVELKRRVTIHCLKAWHYLIPILKNYQHPEVAFQLHSYNGGPKLIEQLLALNCYFSFSCSLTRTKNHKAHAALRILPLERILIETDAPDIPPEINGQVDFSQQNEPANLDLVLEKAALLKNMEAKTLEAVLWQNSLAFLGPLVGHFSFE